MNFVSLEFLIFLPCVFFIFWTGGAFKTQKWQNSLLLLASYVFYGFWDWRFLFLIIGSTVVDFIVGIQISRSDKESSRKLYLLLSVVANLGALAFFKYFNFFLDSLVSVFDAVGFKVDTFTLSILLPVGISFYTFQTLSYTIDVYKRKIDPVYDMVSFATFVSFFPQLVAGPIERASHLLPQFQVTRTFSYSLFADGLRQMLWGFFAKVVIADKLAPIANYYFKAGSVDQFSTPELIVGVVAFTFQIYCDFSGYSNIAIGTAKLFGFDLMTNFRTPYFSVSIAQFWSRWHISLTSWFRDYVYIPLGGNRLSLARTIINVFIVFLVSGLWHGANWTYVAWGGLNALLFIPGFIAKHLDLELNIPINKRLRSLLSSLLTFSLVSLTWIYFRSTDIDHANTYILRLFAGVPESDWAAMQMPSVLTLVYLFLFIASEWLTQQDKFALEPVRKFSWLIRWSIYTVLVLILGSELNIDSAEDFIYFQF